jgi:hypothetical protein
VSDSAVARKTLGTTMTGAAERPGPGDADGRGRAAIFVQGNQVCWLLNATNIGRATAAHIHQGGPSVAGPIVVPLTPPNPFSTQCSTVQASLANQLRSNPAGFYVNVHTGAFPNGAIRGQLAD